IRNFATYLYSIFNERSSSKKASTTSYSLPTTSSLKKQVPVHSQAIYYIKTPRARCPPKIFENFPAWRACVPAALSPEGMQYPLLRDWHDRERSWLPPRTRKCHARSAG